MSKKVVPGSITAPYTRRQGDFSPNLVGFQFTDSSSFLTFGNFALTTNLASITGRVFNTGDFSEEYSLETLNLSESESSLFNENASYKIDTKLRYNKSNFLNYVYFSDAESFVEKEVEGIVLKWLGSVYLTPNGFSFTVQNHVYDITNDTTTFSLPISLIKNTFGLVTEDIQGSSPVLDVSDIKTLKFSFDSYEIKNEFGQFPIIGYTGNTETNPFITLKVDGLVWSGLTSINGNFTYHIKPKDNVLNKLFFNNLSDFQNQLLNRYTLPKYTLKLVIPKKNDLGFTFETTQELTWPTSDGYNIDVSGRDYGTYLEDLFSLARDFDLKTTNLINRRLISESILNFDTAGDGNEITGRKIDKLNKIWGREYDHIKRYIDGISFANVVTYSGVDNTPDELIKMMASNLGFDTIQSFSDNDLIKYLTETNQSVFNDELTSLTTKELDTELWRRLIINAWWLFKSKGTRKVIEFFLGLFNIDERLIDFNEYVYLVEKRLSKQTIITKLNEIVGIGVIQEENLAIDDEGFPKILPNTPEYYFQMDGFWYNGGSTEGELPKLNGNNPHFGPYDFGKKYFEPFKCFIPNFNPTPEILTLNTLNFNYFKDYSLGTVDGVGETTTIVGDQITTQNNDGTNILNEYSAFYGDLMNNTGRVTQGGLIVNAGRVDEESNNGTGSFKITLRKGNPNTCNLFCPEELDFDVDNGIITFTNVNNIKIPLTNEECCSERGFYNYLNTDSESPNIVGVPQEKLCYWCPPKEFFVGQVKILTNKEGDSVTQIQYFYRPPGVGLNFQSGQVKPVISEDCCVLRGFVWDDAKKICTNKSDGNTIGDSIDDIDNSGGPVTG